MESSLGPKMSSGREGFKQSNPSSHDVGPDGISVNVAEHVVENIKTPVNNSNEDDKCVLCWRLLRQRSPWSSHRIVRSGDLPVASVLCCSHVFHAECLEEMTPRSKIHDPSCPTCLKDAAGKGEASSSALKPLRLPVVLGSAESKQVANTLTGGAGNISERLSEHLDSGLRRNQSSLLMPRRSGSSLMKNHFKKHISFKGKAVNDLFSVKAAASRRRSVPPNPDSSHNSQNPVGCSKAVRLSKK
ncbi:hypothetical protein ACLOJK_000681 [Asimina triloba]